MKSSPNLEDVLARELAFHERLYAGDSQRRFARAAVRAFRAHLVARILRLTGAGRGSRVLSIGCGIGDTELVMAPHVGQITGIDLSPSGIKQAQADAQRAGVTNARFVQGVLGSTDLGGGPFDLVIAIFFLHHLPDPALRDFPRLLAPLLAPGGRFYALDPSSDRLSGKVGALLVPNLMKKHQSPDERPINPRQAVEIFSAAGFDCRTGMYDYVSTPLAGLFNGWEFGYRLSRRVDDLLVRTPLLKRWGSNVELLVKLRQGDGGC